MPRNRRWFRLGLTILVLLLTVILSPQLYESTAMNKAAILVSKGLATDSLLLSDAERMSESQWPLACRANWLRGRVSDSLGDHDARDAAWERLVQCEPDFIPVLRNFAPDHRALAQLSVRARPDIGESWFWLASIVARDSLDEAIGYYREGLRLDPLDGLRWKELGDLLEEDSPDEALDAYLQSCYRGDPGYNGCWNAGMLGLRLGDVEAAIRILSVSRWRPAQDEAERLRSQISGDGRR